MTWEDGPSKLHRVSEVRDFAYPLSPTTLPDKIFHVDLPESPSCAVSPTPASPSTSPSTITFSEQQSPSAGSASSAYTRFPLHRKSSTQPMTSRQIAAAGFEKHLRRCLPGTSKAAGAKEMTVDVMRQSSLNPESFVTVERKEKAERALRRVKTEGDEPGGSGWRSARWKGKDTQMQNVRAAGSREGWMQSRTQMLGSRRISTVEQ